MGIHWKRGAVSPDRAGKGVRKIAEWTLIAFSGYVVFSMSWNWFYPVRWKSLEAAWSNEFHIAPARASAVSAIRDCNFTTEAGLDAIVHTVSKLNGATDTKSRIGQDIRSCRTRIAVAVKARKENYVQDSLLVYSTIPSLKRTISTLRSDSASNAQKITNLQLGLSKALAVIASKPPTQVAPQVATAPRQVVTRPVSKTPFTRKAAKISKVERPRQPCNRWGDTDPRICANRP